jgi:hypothetical protein
VFIRNVCVSSMSAEVRSPSCALSLNAPLFLSAHTYPLQPGTILVCHGALPNLQTSKRKLESHTFAGNLLPLYLSTRSSSLGTITCCETIAYFKYAPVKAKIKIITNAHCIVICNLDHAVRQTQRPPLVGKVSTNSSL